MWERQSLGRRGPGGGEGLLSLLLLQQLIGTSISHLIVSSRLVQIDTCARSVNDAIRNGTRARRWQVGMPGEGRERRRGTQERRRGKGEEMEGGRREGLCVLWDKLD